MTLTVTHTLSLVTALSCLVAGMCCGLRHLLLRPKPSSWPSLSAPAGFSLFLLAVVLTYMGIRLIAAVVEGTQTIPPNATPHFAILAATLAIYKVALLHNDFHKRREWVMQQLRQDGYIIAPPSR